MYSGGQKIVLLADLDCFFVEVERLHRPELRGRPVVIGGRPGLRGVVAACSYEARELGIKSAMPMNEAYRRAGMSWQLDGRRAEAMLQPSDVPGSEEGLGIRELGARQEIQDMSGAGRRAGQEMIADTAVRATKDRRRDAAATHNVRGGGPPWHDGQRWPSSHDGQGRPSSQNTSSGVVFLHEGLFGNYTLYSRRVQDILRDSVPVFHARSIDEFELDVSGCERLFARDYGGIVPFAEYLRRRVRTEVGLRLSIGIGPSRLVAKMASRHAKPDGVFRVLPEEVLAFLGPHDVQAVPGIGPATSAVLRDMGINRVEQLLHQPAAFLRRVFGSGISSLVTALREGCDTLEESGEAFPRALPMGYVGGSEASPFGTPGSGRRSGPEADDGMEPPSASRPKSIGHETTFERDEIDPAVWERALWRLTEDACQRLRAADLRARQVTVKIRYSDFGTLTHGGPLAEASDVDDVVFTRAMELFHEANTRRLRIRLLGVRLEKLCAGASQGLLFESRRDRRAHDFFAAVDRLRARHGKDCLMVGPGVARLTQPRRLEALSTAGIQTGFMHGREGTRG